MMRALGLAVVFLVPASSLEADDGKQAYLEQKCDRCHAVQSHDIEATVKSERMRGPDLSTIGDERDAEWLQKFLMKEIDVDGVKHRVAFNGDEKDAVAISKWLASLKTE